MKPTLRIVTSVGVALAMLSTCDPGAHAAETVVSSEAETTTVNLYAGVAAWNSYVPGQGWRLRIYRAGTTSFAPVRAKPRPFDVDLGPDEHGRVTAVYSRCAPPGDGQDVPVDCRLYRYTLGGRERRIHGVSRKGYSEHQPTIWHSRLAFARYRVRGAGEVVDRLFLMRGKRVRQMPRGTLRRGVDPPDTDAEAGTLQLRGARLAFSWQYSAERCQTESTDPDPDGFNPFPEASEMWLVKTSNAQAKRVDEGCSDDSKQIGDPSLDAFGLSYLRYGQASAVTQHTIRLPDGKTFDRPLAPTTRSLSQDGNTAVIQRAVPPTGAERFEHYEIVLETLPGARLLP